MYRGYQVDRQESSAYTTLLLCDYVIKHVTYESKRAHHRSYHRYLFLSLSLVILYRVECTCSYLDHYIELLEISHLPFHPISNLQDRSPPKWRLLKLLPSPKLRGCLMVEHTSWTYGPSSRTSFFSITQGLYPCSPSRSSYSFRQFIHFMPMLIYSPRARADNLVPQTSLPTASTSVKDS